MINYRGKLRKMLAGYDGQAFVLRYWDGEKEAIIGDPEANKLLRRAYRAPWKYPEA